MSTVKVDTLVASDGTSPVTLTKQQAAKQFVWFDGNTTNVVENSFNTSSVTDVGTGDYKPFLTNSMSTTFSVLHISTYRTSRIKGTGSGVSMTATNAYEIDVVLGTDGLTFADTEVGASLLGDLA